jgi:hypothetical protein
MNRGIGARLLMASLNQARAGRDARVHLWVFEANHSARGFYEHEGGRIADRRTIEIVAGAPVSEVRYYWELHAAPPERSPGAPGA